MNLCVSCQLNTIQTISTWNPGRFVDFLGQGRSQCPNLDRPVLWRWKMFTQIEIHIISTISRCNNKALVPQQKKPQRKEERGGKITARPLKDFVPTLLFFWDSHLKTSSENSAFNCMQRTLLAIGAHWPPAPEYCTLENRFPRTCGDFYRLPFAEVSGDCVTDAAYPLLISWPTRQRSLHWKHLYHIPFMVTYDHLSWDVHWISLQYSTSEKKYSTSEKKYSTSEKMSSPGLRSLRATSFRTPSASRINRNWTWKLKHLCFIQTLLKHYIISDPPKLKLKT